MTLPFDVSASNLSEMTRFPLMHFKGRVTGTEYVARDQGGYREIIKFDELVVIATDAVYELPTIELSVNISIDEESKIRRNAPYGKLLESAQNHGFNKISELTGNTVEMKATIMQREIEGSTTRWKEWAIVSVGESVKVDPIDELKAAINGLNGDAAVTQAVMTNAELNKVYGEKAMAKTLISELVNDNVISLDDDGNITAL